MARALIVGCGCYGSELGRRLLDEGWSVRGTSRTQEGAERIGREGLEGVVADPDRVGTVLEHVGDVAVVVWALGAAAGPSAADVNEPRLERMLERLVDTPVRGFVLDEPSDAPAARELAHAASATWRIPVRTVVAERSSGWTEAMRSAVIELIAAEA